MKRNSLFSAFLMASVISTFCGFAFADDTFPPMPNPPQWASVPQTTYDGLFYYHTMTAAAVTDDSLPVYYLFDCVAGGGVDSGWQSGTTWTPGPFLASNYSVYRFYTKDALGNVSLTSAQYDTTGMLVPEPATICLFGLAGLFLRRRK